jgi:hypothetical protein
MSEQDLSLVNEYWKENNYIDQDAAKEQHGDAKKKHLLKYLLYYWVYEDMVLQLEDSEHDRQRRDSLNIENMNKLYSSNKPNMRDTKITQEQGYLGPYQRKLTPADVKQMMIVF